MSDAVIRMSNGRIRSRIARGTGQSLKDRLEQSREAIEKQKKAFSLSAAGLEAEAQKKKGGRK